MKEGNDINKNLVSSNRQLRRCDLFLNMHTYLLIFLVFLLAAGSGVSAQQTLKGKVYDSGTDSVIAAVNIFNTTKKNSTRSAPDGSYSITATEGDILIFSASGFKSDTVHARFDLLITQYDPGLQRHIISLEAVTVRSNYQADSLNRRNYYSHVYAKQPGITGRNRPADGLGITLSPVSFLSKESKQKRALRKRLEKQEEEIFIDQSFPLVWVKSLTGLSGDSLSLFMYRYRPSYAFCRKTDRQGMKLYVNNKVKEFRKLVTKN